MADAGSSSVKKRMFDSNPLFSLLTTHTHHTHPQPSRTQCTRATMTTTMIFKSLSSAVPRTPFPSMPCRWSMHTRPPLQTHRCPSFLLHLACYLTAMDIQTPRTRTTAPPPARPANAAAAEAEEEEESMIPLITMHTCIALTCMHV